MSAKEIVIGAETGMREYWREVWRYRELLYFLAWRDILVRYKQAVIGVAWSVLRPILTIAVFTLVFGFLARMPAAGIPYPILVMTGVLPWQFFSTALSESSNSLVGNANLISKVYFPRVIVPASAVVVSLVDFAISLVLLAVLFAWYGFTPTPRLLALPFFVGMAFLAAAGAGLLFSALIVRYRDFRFIVPFLLQLGLYASPVGYLSSVVPAQWRVAYSLNPMVGVIDGFRWSILGGANEVHWPSLGVSCAFIVILFAAGLRYFRNMERTFADVI